MNKGINLLVLAGLIIAVSLNSLFVIDEKEDGIVFQFGEAIKSDLPTGLNFKLPIIQNVKKYDSRLQTLDEEPNRILTVESKYLIVDSFVKYRITDVRTFYDATSGSFINLNNLLGQRTAFELKNQFGRRTVTELVSGERDQLMKDMRDNLGISVSDLGIEVIDFRVKRIDLPPELSNSVYERMRSERNRLAEELRAEGNELSKEIRSTADKERIILLAEKNDCSLDELSLEELKSIEPKIDNYVMKSISISSSISKKTSFGGTSPRLVLKAISDAKRRYL